MIARLALAARNTVGRSLRLGGIAYSAAQRWTAAALWAQLKVHGYDDACCAAVLGCIDGETSFILSARGDKVNGVPTAGGACQWHQPRRTAIYQHTDIDVWDAPAAKQIDALVAEMTQPWSGYRHVDAALRTAVGLQAKITVLVTKLEQSGSQARDIARRTPMAQHWFDQFAGKKAA